MFDLKTLWVGATSPCLTQWFSEWASPCLTQRHSEWSHHVLLKETVSGATMFYSKRQWVVSPCFIYSKTQWVVSPCFDSKTQWPMTPQLTQSLCERYHDAWLSDRWHRNWLKVSVSDITMFDSVSDFTMFNSASDVTTTDSKTQQTDVTMINSKTRWAMLPCLTQWATSPRLTQSLCERCHHDWLKDSVARSPQDGETPLCQRYHWLFSRTSKCDFWDWQPMLPLILPIIISLTSLVLTSRLGCYAFSGVKLKKKKKYSLSQWDFPHGKFGSFFFPGESQLRHSPSTKP